MDSRDIQVKDRVCVLNIGFFFRVCGCVVCMWRLYLSVFVFVPVSFFPNIDVFFVVFFLSYLFFSLFRNKLFGKGCISFGGVPNMRCRVPSNQYQVSKKGKHIRWLWVMVHGTLHAGQKRKGKQ